MTKKTRKTIIASVIATLYVLATLTACSNGELNNLSSEAVTTTYTEQTPAPETEATEGQTESSVTTIETPAPETEQTTTSDVQNEVETPVPETEAVPPQTEAQVTTPVTTVITTPAPEWDESEVSGTKYVNVSCYSRKKAVLGAETVKLYNVNDKVTVVAKTNTGYYKLDDGSFIHSDYLSDSKVVVTTTTTTPAPKPNDVPSSSNVEKVNLTVYTVKPMVWYYSDADCTQRYGGYECEGHEIRVVEHIKDKGVYRVDTHSGNEYIKCSDVTLTDPVEAMYHYPFDFEAIRQYIIDDAVNNYGLVYNPDYEFEGSSWFPPGQVCKNTPAWILKRNIEGDEYTAGQAEASFDDGSMKPGDTFNVYIERIEVNNDDRIHKLDYDEAWLIYFLRG